MTAVYAESSAVLAWLLGEPTQRRALAELQTAYDVVTSALTLVECARGLLRARLARRIKPTEELAALALLGEAASSWTVLNVTDQVVDGARPSFPRRPASGNGGSVRRGTRRRPGCDARRPSARQCAGAGNGNRAGLATDVRLRCRNRQLINAVSLAKIDADIRSRSEEHTSELQSRFGISYA